MSSHPARPRYSVRFTHTEPDAEEKRIPFANGESARAFFEQLRIAAHPAEPRPVAFAELAMQVGTAPWTVLDSFGEEGGAR